MATAHPTERPVRMVFTTRDGGVSEAPYGSFNLGDHVGDDPAAVAANRGRLAEILGLDAERFMFMEQLHTPTVTEVTADMVGSGPVPASDALVTTLRDVPLVVLTADCVPLLLADQDARVIAAVHAGRIGARNGIVARAVERMVELGANPAAIHAVMGAAASGENYEVPADMAADVESRLPGAKTRTKQGTTGLDIRAGIARQLESLGVGAVDIDPRCTIASENLFSYRREGTTGRQAGVIWMPS
ncbi:peptidoglycan editing factor PgeF [Corynebacterium urealyticum]|uniref:Purine nucleoside phosphorylase n=1 Tax=Corynebacterium urealyticum TaxID=43771 RepID=A0A2W5BC56_9CORY|nr:peptidoglycan editing factor PgeF [Corynebacterium urealyticum]PZP03463.1 MAG: peptidoglycan editing factor PgeF [Corynebacterium urealyticum]WOH93696.1 peptidoglycan editing factor PgeF [Corynebacterium urealyticum]